jgi:exonuclease III
MRIVSWNCNGAFRKKFESLDYLQADILIIQECEDPSQSKDTNYRDWAKNFIWVGNSKNKGLGVFAKDNSILEELEFDQSFGDEKLKWFIPFRYNNNLDIIAIWTQSTYSGYFRYIGQLYKFIMNNSDKINNQVFIGDFNSNKIWDYKRSEGDHSTCVRLLKNKGIFSLYHEFMNENPGEELLPTFYLHRNLTKQYHIDYAFLPRELLTGASISIGTHHEWLEISDHMPLIIEIPKQ